ncbi:MAG: ABC transporter permease [Planctomycetaceae bacterium]|nr:ABC transporter permease [Planctomycetaceae bacterium]
MEIRPEEFLTFAEWFGPAIKYFIIAVPVLTFLAIFGCFLVSAARRGPVEGFYAVATVIATAIGKDLPAASLRRTLAIARLTVKESIRRRVIVSFVIFALIFLFAGWFLDRKSDDPAHLYLSFVLTTTTYLAIVLALFLSTASIPADIKSRTIYTIVTKPVRAGELVLGRIFGFVAVITVLLAVMGVISYFFVVRGMEHEHGVLPEGLAALAPVAEGDASPGWEGTTTMNSYHRHSWKVDDTGRGTTDKIMGHQHQVTRSQDADPSDPVAYEIGAPYGALVARVPIYGQMRFLDSEGNPTQKGISVGKEWEYRSYIEGRTLASAIWRFQGLSDRDYPEYLPLGLTLSVFRTYKGDIVTGVRGIIILKSTDPRNPIQCEPIGFISREYELQQLHIPRKLRMESADGASQREIDLFADLVHEGELDIIVRCDDAVQYFGMAQADLYIEAPDAPFGWNFAKGYIGIWLQMIIVVCLGVMFSTFLSTPVAILGTMFAVLLGFFGSFVQDLWTGKAWGGGPIEALIRLVNQDNVVTPLQFGNFELGVHIVKFMDKVYLTIVRALSGVLPDFSGLGRASEYVAYSFNYYDQLLARQCLTTFVYVTAIAIVGYFFMRTREVAA